jgi:hypothetical protein
MQHIMGSTVRRSASASEVTPFTSGSVRWRSWPLVDSWKWSWVAPVGVLLVAAFTYYVGDSLIMSILAVVALLIAVRSFFFPTTYEITPFGIRRKTIRQIRLIPWTAVHAHQFRRTGLLLYHRTDPTPLNIIGSLFVPYPADTDELVVAARLYLPHSTELPAS